jgi:hypothetical protein
MRWLAQVLAMNSAKRRRHPSEWLKATWAVRRNLCPGHRKSCIFFLIKWIRFGHVHAFRRGRKGWTEMKTKLIALAILAGSSVFAQSRLSVGVQVGGYGQGYYDDGPVYASEQPPCPGPDYDWVDGYWSQDYGRRSWIAGSWMRRRFERPVYDTRFYGNAYRDGSYGRNYGGNYGGNYGSRYGGNSYRGNDQRENYTRQQRDDRGNGGNRGNDRGAERGRSNGQNYNQGNNQNYSRSGNSFRGR